MKDGYSFRAGGGPRCRILGNGRIGSIHARRCRSRRNAIPRWQVPAPLRSILIPQGRRTNDRGSVLRIVTAAVKFLRRPPCIREPLCVQVTFDPRASRVYGILYAGQVLRRA